MAVWTVGWAVPPAPEDGPLGGRTRLLTAVGPVTFSKRGKVSHLGLML